MNCQNHPNVDAVGICKRCSRGLCLECKSELDGQIYCHPCARFYGKIRAGAVPRIAKRDNTGKRSIAAAALAYAALACGLLGLIGFFISFSHKSNDSGYRLAAVFALFLPLLAMILGKVSLWLLGKDASLSYRTIAIIGITLGVIPVVVYVIAFISVFFLIPGGF